MITTAERDAEKTRKRVGDLHARLAAGTEAQTAHRQLRDCLADNGKSWGALTQALEDAFAVGAAFFDPDPQRENAPTLLRADDLQPDDIAYLLAFHDRMDSSDPSEWKDARDQIKVLLEHHGLNWTDLSNLLRAAMDRHPEWQPNLLDALVDAIKHYVWFNNEHDPVLAALWFMHTHVYDRFMHTPRLAVFSQEESSGKSTLVAHLGSRLVRNPYAVGNVTAASLFRRIHNTKPSALIVEGDNQPWGYDFISLLNNGYEKNPGLISRAGKGAATVDYYVFAPLAFDWYLGSHRPLPPRTSLSRCLTIDLDRAPSGSKPPKFKDTDTEWMQRLADLQQGISIWASNVVLNDEPEMPPQLTSRTDRTENNWCPLIAIADSIGRGEIARQAAITKSQRRINDSPRIRLARDIRVVRDAISPRQKIEANELVEELCKLEECSLENNETWNDWTGPAGNEAPHKLKTREVTRLLRTFKPPIRPRTVREGDKTYRGYDFKWFEPIWDQYCDDGDTSTHAKRISHLRVVKE
jgi:hypothetical protein